MINMIAAGEVVERPASVVKELMENSIDAGATEISVAVDDGGRKEICVIDNGCGMDRDDLAVAFDTHATSKVVSSDDLRAIGTLGFRGEALASIASVALINAVTRTADSNTAYCLNIDCGEREPVSPCSGTVGTRIVVRDLFYKVPARRKFMRTAPTEMGHVSEQFIRISLGSMAVKEGGGKTPLDLTLSHNGREVYRLSATEDLLTRVRTLFPMLQTDGREDWIVLEQVQGELRIRGLLGHPDLARSNGKFQYVFLNGRFIRDKTVTHALKEAYRGLLEANRYPVVFLYLEMPLDDYDVNVHPTKTEVRFYNSQRVHSQILSCVRERLLGVDMYAGGVLPATHSATSTDMPVSSSANRERVSRAMGDFFRNQRASIDVPRVASPQVQYSAPTLPAQVHEVSASPMDSLEPVSAVPRFLQIHDSYILAETGDGFIIVDQHALHEKILFERFSQQVTSSGLTAQRLLIPQPIHLSEAQVHLVEVHADLFRKLGIEVIPFGPQSHAIQTFPSSLQKADPIDFVLQLLDLLDENQSVEPDRVLDAVLSMAACKAAIKAHQPLSHHEIQQLLADGHKAESSVRCPHGRPTTIRFTQQELEKQFLRT
jgi:DNA mismatch repair protein MutL